MLDDLTAEEVRTQTRAARYDAVSFASDLSATSKLRPAAFQLRSLMAGQRALRSISW